MNYIIIYLEMEHLLNFLTQEEKGDFLDLLISYGKNQELPKIENKKLLNVFNFMKGRLDTQFEKAKLKAETAKKNGASGGRPIKDIKPSNNPTKPKDNPDKPKKTQSVFIKPTIQEINPIYKKLSDGLLFILEAKLQRKLSSKNWEDEIKKLIEKDLSVRQNPIEDVKQAIQTISNNHGKEYFPVIQSAKSLREKFTKIEDYVKRNSQGKNNQSSALDQYNSILNDLNGDFNE